MVSQPAPPTTLSAHPDDAAPRPAAYAKRLAAFLRRGPGRLALPGLAGAVIMVVGGFGAGALRRQDPLLDSVFLSWMRYGHGKIVCGALVYIGVLLMFYSWVRIGRTVRAGGATPRHVGGMVALWTVPMLFSVPLFSRDAYSYLAQGA